MRSESDIVREFRGVRALCLGDAMLDSYLDGTAARLCSEGPVPVVQVGDETHAPGGAANAAANLRALGADVRFIGIVGSDAPGSRLRSMLRQLRLDDGWLVEDPSARTLHKRRIRADGQYVARLDDGDTSRLTPASASTLSQRVDEALAWCDVIVVSDYGYGVAEAAISRLASHGSTPLIVDSKRLLNFAQTCATIVTPNHAEARIAASAAGMTTVESSRVATATSDARTLLMLLDCQHVAVTMAGDGALLASRDGEMTHVPAHAAHNAADVGAGDSFASALSLALATGADVHTAVRLAVEAGWLAVSQPGTAVVEHQQLLQRASLLGLRATTKTKTLALAEFTERLERARLGGKTVVFTNGVFDILHAGHIQLLREAKALGDILVVGVNSDRSAAQLKQRGRPINPAADRITLVQALESVDYTLLFEEDTPAEIIRRLRPNLHVKGGDYDDVSLPEQEAVDSVGGRVVILPLAGGHSTTALIDRIGALALHQTIEAFDD